MTLIFLGAPGSGKGTQAKRLAEKLELEHISTGDILREAIKKESELGIMARKYMDAGQLVPDEVVLGIIKEELLTQDHKGHIFDGFPRTAAQAEGLDKIFGELGAGISKVINLNVPDDVIVKRLGARLICRNCGHDFNTESKPPRVPGICDICGGELYRRPDDAAAIVQNRLSVYREKTRPIENYYRSKGLLADIDGNRSCDEVFDSVVEAVVG